MLAQDLPKSHGMVTVFKDYGKYFLILPSQCQRILKNKLKKMSPHSPSKFCVERMFVLSQPALSTKLPSLLRMTSMLNHRFLSKPNSFDTLEFGHTHVHIHVQSS